MTIRQVLAGCTLAVMSCASAVAQTAEEPTEVEWGADAELSPFAALDWQSGPTQGDVGRWGTVEVPEGYLYLGREDTQTLLELWENPTSGMEQAALLPVDGDWSLFFEFDPIGYVKDDDQDDLDPDAMLESMQESSAASNAERVRRGWPEYHLVGWETAPDYNASTRNLEWGTRGRAEGTENVNHNIRILGREGVMIVTLVGGVEESRTALPTVRGLLDGFRFVEGQRYGDYVSGDKVAEYGLVALVTGGAAAMALKTGFLKKFGKLLVVAVIALGAAVKRLFGRGQD